MSYSSVLVVSDNEAIVTEFIQLLNNRQELLAERTFRFGCHPKNGSLANKKIINQIVEPLDIKKNHKDVSKEYDLVISAHCKQLFPEELVRATKCINVHPGYNPFNRGWYPQVFSILNGYPAGATIHEIDEKLDHGKIIDQERVEILSSDTSLTAYNKIQKAEIKLLEHNLQKILDDNYEALVPDKEGNINFKEDFENLQKIDLEETVTFQQAIDKLRALTHPPYNNAYFVDPVTKQRIWIQISLQQSQEDELHNE